VLVWCTLHYVHTPDARCPALQCAIARMILRRTNQKFDMPKEIGHDECLRQGSHKSQSDARSVRVTVLATPPPPPPLRHQKSREHQWTPWVPREFTSSSSSILLRAQFVPRKRAISLSRPSNSGLGSISNHTCHGATFFIVGFTCTYVLAYY
jgi:hypothetical protein